MAPPIRSSVGTNAALGQRRLAGGALARRHELLDDAVFQRVEADHRQAAAGLEPFHRRIEPGFEIGQLAVDVDADGLEAARGRVDLVLAAASPRRSARPVRRCG
jgi:hypothetical protein